MYKNSLKFVKNIANIVVVLLLINTCNIFGVKIVPINRAQKTLDDVSVDVFVYKIVPYLENDPETLCNLCLASEEIGKLVKSSISEVKFIEKDFLKARCTLCFATKFLFYYTNSRSKF